MLLFKQFAGEGFEIEKKSFLPVSDCTIVIDTPSFIKQRRSIQMRVFLSGRKNHGDLS